MTHIENMTRVPALAGRYDFYGAVHKGLRRAQCNMLAAVGTADFADAQQTDALLDEFRRLLGLAAAHVVHEDATVHIALRSLSLPTDLIDEQHDDHRAAFLAFDALADRVENAEGPARLEAGRALYLAFAAYVADDFAHMHEEETVVMPLLWQHFTDAELLDMEMRIIGSMSPEENMAFTRIMVPAMAPAERRAMVGGMFRSMPRPVFDAVIGFAIRPVLAPAEFAALSNDIGLAA
ncbi:hemerythrin domain-containing protein [Martelella endophytica]|uniref:Hemerythrin-like domain-containing protein n=1 Tax=Martelella endophytica TaxID=1486262 RepID=A0A0D5LV46_MAREN|nr:hypothetical protein [Martelella endophytica]AJY47642.1 hypothetical protein TM49_21360 [Martelella endophytica]